MIIVVCDLKNQRYQQINFEMLGKARSLESVDQSEVLAIVIGGGEQDSFTDLFKHGAQKILYNQFEVSYNPWMITQFISKIVMEQNPDLVMLPASGLYKCVSASVAVTVHGGLTADCIEIHRNDQMEYVFTRAAMGASVIAEIICINTNIRLCTIKENVFSGYIKTIDINAVESEYVCLETENYYARFVKPIEQVILENEEKNYLDKAKIVFSVGRGVKPQDLEDIKVIAHKYNAELGGTRVLIEEGLLPKSRQIGQSGITVIPNLYIAIGISGASQHIVGMQNSQKIIAINNDANAPIFEYADYAVIADSHEIIQSLKKGLK